MTKNFIILALILCISCCLSVPIFDKDALTSEHNNITSENNTTIKDSVEANHKNIIINENASSTINNTVGSDKKSKTIDASEKNIAQKSKDGAKIENENSTNVQNVSSKNSTTKIDKIDPENVQNQTLKNNATFTSNVNTTANVFKERKIEGRIKAKSNKQNKENRKKNPKNSVTNNKDFQFSDSNNSETNSKIKDKTVSSTNDTVDLKEKSVNSQNQSLVNNPITALKFKDGAKIENKIFENVQNVSSKNITTRIDNIKLKNDESLASNTNDTLITIFLKERKLQTKVKPKTNKENKKKTAKNSKKKLTVKNADDEENPEGDDEQENPDEEDDESEQDSPEEDDDESEDDPEEEGDGNEDDPPEEESDENEEGSPDEDVEEPFQDDDATEQVNLPDPLKCYSCSKDCNNPSSLALIDCSHNETECFVKIENDQIERGCAGPEHAADGTGIIRCNTDKCNNMEMSSYHPQVILTTTTQPTSKASNLNNNRIMFLSWVIVLMLII